MANVFISTSLNRDMVDLCNKCVKNMLNICSLKERFIQDKWEEPAFSIKDDEIVDCLFFIENQQLSKKEEQKFT